MNEARRKPAEKVAGGRTVNASSMFPCDNTIQRQCFRPPKN